MSVIRPPEIVTFTWVSPNWLGKSWPVYCPSLYSVFEGVGVGVLESLGVAEGLGLGLAWETSAAGLRGRATAGVLKLKSSTTAIAVATMATAARVGTMGLITARIA